jgi:nicotinate dehydrogenase subunit A
MPTYSFRLNGRPASVNVWDPDEPLLYALRGSLGLHGTKFGCGLGQCGACTVIVDKRAERACVLPMKSLAGRDVTTIEGVGSPERPDRLQAAFIAEQAAQCGYCTSGMIMRARVLLTETPRPTADQVAQALSGNLCRCGTHTRILRAVMRASKP